MNRIRIILAFLTVFSACLHAQPGKSQYRHITEEDGLSSNQVRAIIQDRLGLVWMGTNQGLDRYDGRSFQNIPLSDKTKGATVYSMCEDDDVIWLGTDKGLSSYSYATGEVSYFDASTADGMHISEQVSGISKDMDGNLWVSTFGQGVFRYNAEQDKLDYFNMSDSNDLVAGVYVDKSNQVWTVTNWGIYPLYRLNKATDVFEPFYLQSGGVPVVDGGLVIMEDSSQRLWMGTWASGILEIDRLTGRVTRHLASPSARKGTTHIHSLLETEPGKILVGSDDGLYLYNIETQEIDLLADNGSDNNIAGRFVYPLMKDREGGIWAGTYYGGVNYLSSFSSQFDSYDDGGKGLLGRVVGRFCEDRFHNIWIASDDRGLACIDKSGNISNYLPTSNVHALCVDGDDLWIGTYAEGVTVLNIPTGKMRTYLPSPGDETSIDGTSSYSIFKDREGHIWIATMGGVNLYDRREDNFRRMTKKSFTAIDIDQDNQGNIWFSMDGDGLMKYDVTTGQWKSYSRTEEAGSLPSDYVNCAYLDSRGVFWIGTSEGLCTYDYETDSFVQHEIEQSLSNICGIVEDQQVLWITTTHGLMRYNPANGVKQVFTTSDGLQSNQFINNSIFKASDGRVYVGTANGFNSFYPYQIKTNSIVPKVVITSPGLDMSEGAEPCIELTYKDKSLRLSFASLSYIAPSKNLYAYMLEGFDKEWNYIGNQNTATYTNIPAGTYKFLVKGSNSDSVWNDVPTELKVIVHPHILLSAPFKMMYGIFIVLAFIAVFSLFVRRNEKKYVNQMKELSSKKEKEVFEAKIEFFTMIAHEIRTPVSLIIGPLEKVMKKTDQIPEAMATDLNMINHNSQRLLYLVNQLLDFRKVEQDAMKMRFLSQPLAPLMREICERFEPTITYNGARLIVEYPSEDFCPCIDSEAMTKLISNLLTNAGKYTKDTVKLTCGIHPTDDTMFNISVYDNGCGISPEEQAKIFRPFYQTAENKPGTGIGLSLVKSIAELHGGIISVRSELGKYSVFTATLPIYQETGSAVKVDEPNGVKMESEDVEFEDILTSDLVEKQSEYKPCVLLVDDNEEMITFLKSTFSDTYQILSASDGIEALELLRDHPDVALVVADWMMPRMDGVELCREVRTNTDLSHIPFILLTAKTDDASKVVGMDCGADAYIEKPFSVQYLEACIKNLVGLRAMLRNKYSSSPLIPLTSVANNNTDTNFLKNMTDIIEAHFSDSNLSVDFLTEQMGISRSSLYNKIKALTDKTPNELIQIMRLKKAAQLLRENKYRINEICYMVGFNNPSYFSKCFYKQFGMKPGEFASQSEE